MEPKHAQLQQLLFGRPLHVSLLLMLPSSDIVKRRGAPIPRTSLVGTSRPLFLRRRGINEKEVHPFCLDLIPT